MPYEKQNIKIPVFERMKYKTMNAFSELSFYLEYRKHIIHRIQRHTIHKGQIAE